jgi:hypothetical protein
MRVLGARLLKGAGVPEDREGGRAWLTKAAEAGDPLAMRILGVRLLEGDGVPEDREGGRAWLAKAAEAGDPLAMRILGERLLKGAGVPEDREGGRAWLAKAAGAGEPLAMLELAEVLLENRELSPKSSEEVAQLLARAKGHPDIQPHILARVLYLFGRLRDAAEVLLKAFAANDATVGNNLTFMATAGNNLAFMLRRGEVPADLSCPPIDELLAPGLASSINFVELNRALCLAAGFQRSVDWTAADQIIRNLSSPEELISWWHGRAWAGDAEGHLVLGWLVRHRLVADPDGWTFERRFEEARKGGWDVPDWMLQPVS